MKRYIILFFIPVLLCSLFIYTATHADDARTIRVGIYENQPKIFTDKSGNASGFWPEIINYIASRENWKIEYVHCNWPEYVQKLENNEIDMMPDVAYTEERSELHDFSHEPVYISWSMVYTRKGTDIQSIVDLEGKNIAVLKGSINVEGPEGIKKLVDAFNINCTFTETDSYDAVFKLIQNGEADAGVASKDFGNQHASEYNIIKTAIIFQPSLIYFAFPKDFSLTPYLIDRIDYDIKQLKEDQNSIYYQALANWLGAQPIEKNVIPAWITWILIGIGIVALLLAAGSFILRSQVKARTKQLTEEINERKKAEQALRDSEEKLRTTFESMSEGLTITDLKGNIIDINGTALRLHRFDHKEDMIGKSIFELISQDDQIIIQENLINTTDKDYRGIIEHNMLTRDGAQFPAEIRTSILQDELGKPAAMVAITSDITERKRVEEERKESTQKLIKAMGSTIEAIALTVEMRDMYTAGHQRRVMRLAIAIAVEMELSDEEINAIRMAGIVHDIGKIQVPAEILNKPGKLTPIEFDMIRNHPVVGYDILKNIEFAWPVANIVLQHHERINGSGYPFGISGSDILLESRILSVADVVEAMATHRPYRPALGIDEALKEITSNRGILYDPVVVDACNNLFLEKKYVLEQ